MADDGIFDWQYSVDAESGWELSSWVYDEERYWSGFPPKGETDAQPARLPEWAVGPFRKYAGNPVLGPSAGAWDRGRFGGGVHNGAIVRAAGRFHYVYRGERPCEPVDGIDYLCKIGLAESADGHRFTKVTTGAPLFGADDPFSYEDVSLVRLGGTFHLFCNRWDWKRIDDPAVSGCWHASSTDLRRWKEHGLVYPNADRIHRNGVVLCGPDNRPVRVDGSYLMYVNGHIVGRSDDLEHWESTQLTTRVGRAARGASPWPTTRTIRTTFCSLPAATTAATSTRSARCGFPSGTRPPRWRGCRGRYCAPTPAIRTRAGATRPIRRARCRPTAIAFSSTD